MKIITTAAYTSTVREFSGFTSVSNIKTELAIDFGSETMTLNSCMSHLYNCQAISYKEKKNAKTDEAKIKLIKIHLDKLKF